MEFVIFALLTSALIGGIVRAGRKRKAKQSLTLKEQRKRDLIDEVVILNETVIRK